MTATIIPFKPAPSTDASALVSAWYRLTRQEQVFVEQCARNLLATQHAQSQSGQGA